MQKIDVYDIPNELSSNGDRDRIGNDNNILYFASFNARKARSEQKNSTFYLHCNFNWRKIIFIAFLHVPFVYIYDAYRYLVDKINRYINFKKMHCQQLFLYCGPQKRYSSVLFSAICNFSFNFCIQIGGDITITIVVIIAANAAVCWWRLWVSSCPLLKPNWPWHFFSPHCTRKDFFSTF